MSWESDRAVVVHPDPVLKASGTSSGGCTGARGKTRADMKRWGSSGGAANVSGVLRGLPWVQVDGAWKELLSKGRGAEGCRSVPEDGENGEGSSS